MASSLIDAAGRALHMVERRVQNKGWSWVLLPLLLAMVGCSGAPEAPSGPPAYLRAVDASFLPLQEGEGATVFTPDGEPKPMLQLLAAAGINTVRVRLWHSPSDGVSGLPEVAAFADRIRTAGLSVWLCMHYSDTWADPGNQQTPAAWAGLSPEALEDSFSAYTKRAVARVQPDWVQIGNEINPGMCWPTGAYPSNADQLERLLQAGIDAAREARPQVRIMLHYAGYAGALSFFDRYGTLEYQAIGLSYYPWWHGEDPDPFFSTLADLSERYNKDVLIAETAYPFTLGFDDFTNNIIGLPEQLVDGFPASPEGQAAWAADMDARMQALERGIGVAWWGAEWIVWRGATASNGSPWENLALFDFEGRLLPAAMALGGR